MQAFSYGLAKNLFDSSDRTIAVWSLLSLATAAAAILAFYGGGILSRSSLT